LCLDELLLRLFCLSFCIRLTRQCGRNKLRDGFFALFFQLLQGSIALNQLVLVLDQGLLTFNQGLIFPAVLDNGRIALQHQSIPQLRTLAD
jgi:hypothetical protein